MAPTDGDPEVGSYPKEQCSHGCCKGHNPKWVVPENKQSIESYLPRPTAILGRTTFLTKKHCGQPMLRVKLAVRCGICGSLRKQDYCGEPYAFCQCCGYHENIPYDF